MRVSQRVRRFATFVQGACDPAGDIVKRQIAEFPGRVAQSDGHLLADGEDDLRVIGRIVIELAVTDFGYVVVGSRAIPGAALFNFFEQTDFAEKVARVEIGNDHFLAVFIFQNDRKGAINYVIQGVAFVHFVDNRGAF